MALIDDANYDEIPVEKFGLAVLAGLGADPNALKVAKMQTKESDEELKWVSGAKCRILLGKHKGQYGSISGMDGDAGRVIVKLTISQEIIRILQPMVQLVNKAEYNKYANCINQQEVDRYKANEPRSRSLVTKPTESITRDKNGSARDRSVTDKNSSLFRPGLQMTFLDKAYATGKYYKHKVTLISVTDNLHTCSTNSGHVVKDVKAKYLQTIVPRELGSKVMILHGSRTGELGKLYERDDKRQEVVVRTRAATKILLNFDQVCAVKDVS